MILFTKKNIPIHVFKCSKEPEFKTISGHYWEEQKFKLDGKTTPFKYDLFQGAKYYYFKYEDRWMRFKSRLQLTEKYKYEFNAFDGFELFSRVQKAHCSAE